MSPLLDVQQRSRELGRLRIGAKTVTDGGKERPTKLDAFRFTTNSPTVARHVADTYGGQARPWEGGTQAWEVFTEATSFDVMVPAGELALSQWHELWDAGGCKRRCDGVTESLTQVPCLCPPPGPDRLALSQQGQACKPTTRVNVILPDIPDIGVWRFESHGYYAAVEIGGTAELLSRARDAGQIVPAALRLEQRSRTSGGQTKRYPVVVLEVKVTLRELLEGAGTDIRQSLPPAPTPRAAIEAAARPVRPTAEDAQGLYELAVAATSREQLVELGKEARAKGWMDAYVADADGVQEPLLQAFQSLAERFPR
jgi:hypothetical protein